MHTTEGRGNLGILRKYYGVIIGIVPGRCFLQSADILNALTRTLTLVSCLARNQQINDFAQPTSVYRNLNDLLLSHAALYTDKEVFRFLREQPQGDVCLTYDGLLRRSRAIARQLQPLVGVGGRAILAFPPGLEFIEAFFGCCLAGCIPVPVAPLSQNRRTLSLLSSVSADCEPAAVLSSADGLRRWRAEQTLLPQDLRFVATDEIDLADGQAWNEPRLDGQSIAFIQYTSGSTSTPKGVTVSHDNLLYNSALIQQAFENSVDSRGVFWLPLYHDMGLIGGVIQTLFCGGSSILMAPASFLQRPLSWLQAISDSRATISGGPDFAYELCTRKIKPEECSQLDLSSWELAFTGAEKIRKETLDRFAEVFSPFGFRRDAFYPCYGLAEATLMVSGGRKCEPPSSLQVDAEALSQHQVVPSLQPNPTGRVKSLVACGRALPGQSIRIVDPKTRKACQPGEVGEIWVTGNSVADGYFNRPRESAQVFRARLDPEDAEAGCFLRTGDLGFVRDDNLYLTGRRKDLIIVRGRNYYPHDIEATVERVDSCFRIGSCAAFAIEGRNPHARAHESEHLVVIQELEPRARDVAANALIAAVRRAVATEHEIDVDAVVLTKAGSIPRTSSGKIRRAICREQYLAGELTILAAWTNQSQIDSGQEHPSPISKRPKCDAPTCQEIESWLVTRIAKRLHMAPGKVSVVTPFEEFGMSSIDAVEITAALEDWIGRPLSPTVVYNYPTITALAKWLGGCECASNEKVEQEPAATDTLLAEVAALSEAEMRSFIEHELDKQKG